MDGRENEQTLAVKQRGVRDERGAGFVMACTGTSSEQLRSRNQGRALISTPGLSGVKRSQRQPSRAEALPPAAGEPTEGWGSSRSRFRTAQVAANVKATTKSSGLGTDKARCAGGHRQLELKLNSYRFFWRGEGRSPEIKTAEVVRLKISPSDSLWRV